MGCRFRHGRHGVGWYGLVGGFGLRVRVRLRGHGWRGNGKAGRVGRADRLGCGCVAGDGWRRIRVGRNRGWTGWGHLRHRKIAGRGVLHGKGQGVGRSDSRAGGRWGFSGGAHQRFGQDWDVLIVGRDRPGYDRGRMIRLRPHGHWRVFGWRAFGCGLGEGVGKGPGAWMRWQVQGCQTGCALIRGGWTRRWCKGRQWQRCCFGGERQGALALGLRCFGERGRCSDRLGRRACKRRRERGRKGCRAFRTRCHGGFGIRKTGDDQDLGRGWRGLLRAGLRGTRMRERIGAWQGGREERNSRPVNVLRPLAADEDRGGRDGAGLGVGQGGGGSGRELARNVRGGTVGQRGGFRRALRAQLLGGRRSRGGFGRVAHGRGRLRVCNRRAQL